LYGLYHFLPQIVHCLHLSSFKRNFSCFCARSCIIKWVLDDF
jgi:hypothetical protein